LFGYRFDVVPYKENSNGVKINGIWNGLIGQVYRGVFDNEIFRINCGNKFLLINTMLLNEPRKWIWQYHLLPFPFSVTKQLIFAVTSVGVERVFLSATLHQQFPIGE